MRPATPIVVLMALWIGNPVPTLAGADKQTISTEHSVVYKDLRPDLFMRDWLVCGPFVVGDPLEVPEEAEPLKKSFTHDFLTEQGGESGIEPVSGMSHHWRGGTYIWQRVVGKGDFISFMDLVGPKQHAVAYAYAEIEMARPVSATLGLGSDDGVKVWVNGELVHENWLFRSYAEDQDRVPIRLRQGRNRLLIKVQNGYNPPWGFACRLMSARAINRALIVSAGYWWNPDPAAVRALLDRLEPALAVGPAEIGRNWPLDTFVRPSYRESCFRVLSFSLPPSLRQRLGHVAERLYRMGKDLPLRTRSDASTVAAWFYAAAGRRSQAIAASTAALRLAGDHEAASFLLAKLRYQASGKRDEPPVDQYLKWEMTRQKIPGMSVAVVRGGKVALMKAYGLANVELSVPATIDSVYRLASLSKPFTAIAIMLLVQEGKVSLDDPIRKYRPELPASWSSITVRHLLTHTAGLPDYLNEVPAPPGGYSQETSPETLVQMIAGLPLKFPPGEQWHYDNTAFVLLRLIIETVSGKSYAEFMVERVFRPLGMTSTRVYSFREIIKNRAGGYAWEENNTLRNSNDLDPSWGTSGAELASTVADMVKFDAALSGEKLLKRPMLDQMWTPTKLPGGVTVGWGMGWALGSYGNYRKIGHEGSSRGVVSLYMRIPEPKYTVILLVPLYDVSARDMAAQITDLYLPLSKPITDKDPQTTVQLKRVLLRLTEGEVDPASFMPQVRATLLREARQAHAYYQALGPLRSFALISQTDDGPHRTLRYRTMFRDASWIHQFVLSRDGKIEEFGVEPEE